MGCARPALLSFVSVGSAGAVGSAWALADRWCARRWPRGVGALLVTVGIWWSLVAGDATVARGRHVGVELVDVGLLAECPHVAGEPVQQHAEREDQAGEQHADRDEVQHDLLHGGCRTLRYGRLPPPDQDLREER